jgi:putative holliday junction resolvase
MHILAIDPGEKRIGLALSDPTGTIASPLTVLTHISYGENASRIVDLATERGAEKIVIGQALSMDGESTASSRRAGRLAGAIRAQTSIPVEFWDETGSTKAAREARIAMGVSRKKRSGHLDEIAATVILQSYLDHLRGDEFY